MKNIINLAALFILALSGCEKSPLPSPEPNESDIISFNISREESDNGGTKSISSGSMPQDERKAIEDGWYGINSDGHIFNAPSSTSSIYSSEQDSPLTRAVKNDFITGDKIGVFSYELLDGTWNSTPSEPQSNEAPAFMNDLPVTLQSGDVWDYGTKKEWPEAPTGLKFFGYYPYEGTSVTGKPTTTTAGYPSFVFTNTPSSATISDQSAYFEEQVDFMYAQTNTLFKNSAVGGFAPLNFKHALTKIRISSKLEVLPENPTLPGEDPEEFIYNPDLIKKFSITKVELKEIPTSGKLTTDNTAAGASWSELGGKTTLQFTETAVLKDDNTATDAEEDRAHWLVGGEDSNVALLAIPHTGESTVGELTDRIVVVLHYEMDYEIRPNPELPSDPVTNPSYHELRTGTIEKALDDTWEMSKALHYAIKIDPRTLQAYVGTELIDWGSTFDITTSVEYTYLYVEKPEFTRYYHTLEDIPLNIFFRTNAPSKKEDGITDNITVEFIRTSEEIFQMAKPAPTTEEQAADTLNYRDYKNYPRLRNSLDLDLTGINPAVECIFTPANPSQGEVRYISEEIIIKAGIISLRVKVNLIPQQPYYLMNKESLTEYLRADPGDDPRKLYSNCYFINPDPDTELSEQYSRKFFIPINHQIETFWGQHGKNILDNDTWDVKIYAYDTPGAINEIILLKEEDMAGDPDKVSPDDKLFDTFSVTIPERYSNHGNILVSVLGPQQEILWIWHLWVTDYDPYEIFDPKNLTTAIPKVGDVIEGGTPPSIWRESAKFGGRSYRHTVFDFSWVMDRNIGATAATFEGQGGLGNTGWLVYQYGRPTPIFGHNAKFADGTFYTTKRHNVDISGKVDILTAIQNPNTIYYSSSGQNWCSDANTQGSVWNDTVLKHPTFSEPLVNSATEDYYQKSFFDPSPLGYMLPPMKEFGPTTTTSNPWTVQDNGKTYKMSSGNTFFASNNIDPKTGKVSLAILSTFSVWSNSSYADSEHAGANEFDVYVSKANVEWNPSTFRTFGGPIRCIDQYKVE